MLLNQISLKTKKKYIYERLYKSNNYTIDLVSIGTRDEKTNNIIHR